MSHKKTKQKQTDSKNDRITTDKKQNVFSDREHDIYSDRKETSAGNYCD